MKKAFLKHSAGKLSEFFGPTRGETDNMLIKGNIDQLN